MWTYNADCAIDEYVPVVEIEAYAGCTAYPYLNVTVKNNGTRTYTSILYIFHTEPLVEENTVGVAVVTVVYGKNQTVWKFYPDGRIKAPPLTPGTYDIYAYVDYLDYELNIPNNGPFKVATLKVRFVGDVSGNDWVDTGDLIKIGSALWSLIEGKIEDPEKYNPFADVNGNGTIDTGDLIVTGGVLWTGIPP